MPYALKCVDLVAHNVFSSLGLKVKVRPLLDQSILDDMEDFGYELDSEYYGQEPWNFPEYLPRGKCACGSSYGCSGACSPYYPDFPTLEEWKARKQRGDFIGKEFRELQFCEADDDAMFRREVKELVSIRSMLRHTLVLLTKTTQRTCK
jgi:hypothetical protein